MKKQKKSFDHKLMIRYYIFIVVLFPLSFILPIRFIFFISINLIGILTLISIIHKKKNGWIWNKPNKKGVGTSILSVVGGIVLIFVAVNAFGGMNGPITPWICASIGITYFNFLSGLNLADKTNAEFIARTSNIIPTKIVVKKEVDKFNKLRIGFKIVFFISWFAGMYLFYSYSEYTKTYSKEKTEFKNIEIQSHGQTYYVHRKDKDLITTKSIIIIPFFTLSIFIPVIMKFRFGIDLIGKKKESDL